MDKIRRVDPYTCGCTDCLTGYSIPLGQAGQSTLLKLVSRRIMNATGYDLSDFTITIVPPTN